MHNITYVHKSTNNTFVYSGPTHTCWPVTKHIYGFKYLFRVICKIQQAMYISTYIHNYVSIQSLYHNYYACTYVSMYLNMHGDEMG